MNYNPAINVGDLLTRPKLLGFVDHMGVAVAPDIVLQNTPEKGEHLSTVDEFSAGQQIKVYRTGADPSTVVARARKALENPKKYDPIFRNCQHTTYEIIRGVAKSPLVIAGVIVIAGTLLLLLLSRRR